MVYVLAICLWCRKLFVLWSYMSCYIFESKMYLKNYREMGRVITNTLCKFD